MQQGLHPERHRHRIVEQGQGEGDPGAQGHAGGHLREPQMVYSANGNRRWFRQKEKDEKERLKKSKG